MANNNLLTNFIKARYAEWAGDIYYCHDLLEDFSGRTFLEKEDKQSKSIEAAKLKQARRPPKASTHPLELIQTAGLHVKEYAHDLIEADLGSIPVIPTPHLRGVIWEISSHEFEFRAYPTDLGWENMLYKNAAKAARRYNGEVYYYKENSHAAENENDVGGVRPRRTTRRKVNGVTWILDGDNFFRQVIVSYLALVRVRGIWAKRELPGDNDVIKKGFEEVLNLLEGEE